MTPPRSKTLRDEIATLIRSFKFHSDFFLVQANRDAATLTGLKIRYNTFKDTEREVDAAFREVMPLLQEEEANTLEEEVTRFRTTFFALAIQVQERIEALEARLQPQPGDVVSFVQPEQRSSLKMKSLEPPQFDGSLDKWLSFRQLFDSQINKNPRLDDVTRYFYLKDAVKIPHGQPNILDSFQVDDANYAEAWKALCERYDDKRKILAVHLSTLFSIKKMATGSSSELCRLIDAFSSCFSALKQQGFELKDEDDFANLLVVYMATFRFDEETMKDWRRHHSDDTATWAQLHKFLKQQQRSLDDRTFMKKAPTKPTEKPTRSFKASTSTSNSASGTIDRCCPMCGDAHLLWGCPMFNQLAVNDRYRFVRDKALCLNCFSKGHTAKSCSSKHRCRTCQALHHTLIHFDNESKSSEWTNRKASSASAPTSEQTQSSTNVPPFKSVTLSKKDDKLPSSEMCNTRAFKVCAASSQTMLSTVSLQVADAEGRFHLCRALLDNGSDTNFIRACFVAMLRLELGSHFTALTGISGSRTSAHFRTFATIRSNYEEYVKRLQFTVLEDITGELPDRSIALETFNIPSKYQLADPSFNESGEIDMLLNAQVFYDCLLSQKVRLESGPMLIHTRFGWIVGGTIIEPHSNANVSHLSAFSFISKSLIDEQIDQQLEKFFKLENLEDEKVLSPEEKYCEQLFTQTTTRDDNGKFIVMLPFKESATYLGRNFSNAMKMSFVLEKRRQKDQTLDKLYCDYMSDYISSGHVTEVSPDIGAFAHYLPHHGVVKMSSTSTKLRPVFNASSVSETGISLNDILCTGPTVQPESLDIVLRFREQPFVLMADVAKMYRQVWVHPSQRDHLRFVWRADMSRPLQHFHHNTVPFGTTSAPYLATRVVQQVAIDSETTFPRASSIIKRSFYVDDLAFGIKTVDEALVLRDEIRNLMAQAGMELTKFASNNPKILEGLSPNNVQSAGDNAMLKILGISYDTAADEFSYRMKSMREGRVTRVSVLSDIASIYDPIGWIGPVVLTAKLFMKHLWITRDGKGWKDVLSQEDEEQWDKFRTTISKVNDIRIPRHCFLSHPKSIELHGFCDASESAYGALVYARSIGSDDSIHVSILCAKSRVAPKNQKTLARLELCAATLLAKLIHRTTITLDTPIKDVTLWSDSTIVLSWIIVPVNRLTTFVANRVSVIQELTHSYEWRHIPGVQNPADVISRGLMPDEIETHDLWWNGPTFFQSDRSTWPESKIVISEADPEVVIEMRKSLIARTPDDIFNLIEFRFSRYLKLVNTFAYIRRFGRMSNTRCGPLTADEREEAEETIIRIVQQNLFADEYQQLSAIRLQQQQQTNIQPHQQQQQARLSKKSPLIALAPFMDRKGLIRVGGRLDSSPGLTFDQKHQILLPQCRFTSVLVTFLHHRHIHPSQQTLLSIVRERYWPIRGKSVIRKVVHGCITCFRAKPTFTQQFMADLPAARVTMTAPFLNTAIDYAGFFMIRTGSTRNAPSTKCYIAMFKCMCTGAIHLEVVSDLTTQAFIAAFTRFVSRRGKPRECFTDNGTCFEGADNELRKIILDMDRDVVQFCTNQQIRWNFTTPRAPHAGGIYESGIKLMKHHLKRAVEKSFNFEQFTTILCKIEAILNSRPITPMSDDPNDLRALTPGHFLIQRPLIALPERQLLNTNMNRLQSWQQLQKVTQDIWHSWYHDYLHHLQSRPVNFREKFEVKVGDMVLLVDRNLPSMKWLLGRVIQLFPSRRSKIIQNVKVMTQHGPKERHIRYLCFLPFETISDDNTVEDDPTTTRVGSAMLNSTAKEDITTPRVGSAMLNSQRWISDDYEET